LQDKINSWKLFFQNNNYEILDYPKPIAEEKFLELYPNIHKSFFENIIKTDILFIMNEDKNGIEGYIGAESYAELTFGLAQNLVYNKSIDLIILKMPSNKVQCYDEIKLWLEIGWIKLFDGGIYE
jgi:hypothetical protein